MFMVANIYFNKVYLIVFLPVYVSFRDLTYFEALENQGGVYFSSKKKKLLRIV